MGTRDGVSSDSADESKDGDRFLEQEAVQLAAIVDRIASNSFPLVMPCEQIGESEADAAQSLTFAEKCDTVELQSYIDEQWRLHRQDAIYDDEKPEPVRRASWARGHYYVHMRHFSMSVVRRMMLH